MKRTLLLVIKSFRFLTVFAFFAFSLFSESSAMGGGGGGGLPNPTSISCGTNVSFDLTSGGYTGGNPTSGDNGCNPCCYAGADLDNDGLQDVNFSVENSVWFQYCNTTTGSQTMTFVIDEPGGGNTCNVQGAIWTGTTLDATTMDCGNSNYGVYGSSPGGAADGFSFTVTIPAGQCAFIMADGYGGATCAGMTISAACPCTTPTVTVSAATNPICSGSSTTLTASGATTYSWYPSASLSSSTGSSVTASPTTTTTYTVTGTTSGCSGTATTTLTVNPLVVTNAGPDQAICAGTSATLAGSISGGTTSGTWSAPSGTFSNANSLTSTYTPSITSGSVTLTLTSTDPAGPCPATTDQVVITVNPVATANAGTDQSVCAGGSITLNGSVGGSASSGTWSAPSGTFSNASNLGATYTPSISSGTVTLTLTTNDPAGACPAVTDQMVVTVTPGATADAGTDQSVCAGGSVTLAGSFGGAATSATWSASSGTFSNASSLTSTYTPSITSGTVTLTLTTNDPAGSCVAVSDQVVITVNQQATVNANIDQTICAGTSATLAGSIGGSATSATWSASSGTFSNASSLSSTYTPSITSGTVTLTLTTNDPAGVCPAVTDQMVITVNQAATANAGTDQSVCAGGTVTLAGSIGGSATSSTWTASSGTFSNASSTTSTYTPSITSGTVTLTLTTNDPAGICPAVTDQVVITVNQAATVNANTDQTVCEGGTVTLAGTIGGSATSATWTAASGSFSNPSSLSSTYTPSITSGTVTLTLTTNDPAGACPAVTDQVVITVNQAATANAGTDQSVCAGGTVTLGGSIGGSATSSTWTASSGTFSNASSTASTYSPSITSGTITLTITTNDPAGICPAASDQVIITVNPNPTVSASASPATICDGESSTLTATGAASYSWSPATGLSATTGSSVTANPSSTTTYTVTGTSSGCSATATVTLTVNPIPVVTALATPATICEGSGSSLSASGATTYSWSDGQTGSPVTVSPATTTTYTVTGTTSGCSNTADVTVTVNPQDDASFNYSSNTFCITGANPSPTVSGTAGGLFTGSAGLIINASTGEIDLTATGLGTFTVTYTTVGACPDANSVSITITSSPDASFSYTGTPYCQSAGTATVTFGAGASGGTFTASPAGLTINSTTGTVTLATSTAGIYTVTNSIAAAGGCSATSATATIEVIANDDATFSYSSSSFCQNASDATPVITGTTGGTFVSSPAGLSVNSSTGVIDVSASTAGAYTVTYTTSGACPDNSSVQVTIVSPPTAGFSYTGSPYCITGGIATITLNGGTTAGTFTASPSGLSLNSSTGEVTLASSTPGTYTVTNTISPVNGCIAVSATSTITITATDDPSFAYSSTTFCTTGADPVPTITGTSGGTFSGSGSLVINSSTGEIDLDASGAGSYTVTYNTSGLCPSSSLVNITITNALTGGFAYAGPYCQSSGTAGIILDPGATAGTFTSSPAGLSLNSTTGSVDLALSTPGTYTVTNTIAASGGCGAVTETASITINADDDATFAYSGGTFCLTGTDPLPTITGTSGGTFSGSGTLVINASTGEIDLDASGLGTYTVSYTTPGACPANSTVTVTISSSPSAGFTYAGPYCQSGGPAAITLDPGASTGVFSASPSGLSINASSGTVDPSASTPGTYTVTNSIAASGGCAAVNATATITINADDDPAFSYSQLIYCQDAVDPSATITGGATGTFSAPAGIVFINTSTGEIDLSASNAGGPYSIVFTTNGICPASSNFSITIEAPDDPSFNYSSASYCQGDTDPSAIITGGANGTFTGTAGLVFANSSSGTIDLDASTAGPHTITFTTNGTCPATATFALTINPEDDATFSYSGGTFCLTGTDPGPTISGTAGGTFSGTSVLVIDPSTGVIDLDASGSGTYTVTYTTTGSCPDSQTATITITTSPDAAFSYASPAYCEGTGAATVIIGAGASSGIFTGSPSGLDIDAATGLIDLTTSAPGIYTVTNTIAASGGCSATTATTTVEIIAQDDATFTYPQSTYCTSEADPLPVISGTSNGTFSANSGLSLNPVTGLIDLSATTPAGYTITYTTNGTCPDSSTFVITVDSVFNATILPTAPFCVNGLPENMGAIDLGGVWSGNGITNSAAGTFNPSIAGVGQHIITYTISGSCGDADTILVTVNPANDASITPAGPYCITDLPDTLAAASSGGIWSGIGITDTLAGIFDPAVSGAGVFTIYYSSPNPCGSTDSLSVTVLASPSIGFTVSQSTSCGPVTVTFTDNTPGISSWTWDFGDGSTSATGPVVSHTFSNTGCYDVTLSASTATGCSASQTVPSMVCVNPVPNASFSMSPSVTTIFAPEVTFTNSSSNATNYSWDFGGLGTSADTNPLFSFPTTGAGSYTICLTAINAGGCIDSTCQNLTVLGEEIIIIIPNVFSPNGDGTNDSFGVFGEGVTSEEGKIFDRWGVEMFSWTTVNTKWDGTGTNGKDATEGVYFYIITYELITGEKITKNGHVTLTR